VAAGIAGWFQNVVDFQALAALFVLLALADLEHGVQSAIDMCPKTCWKCFALVLCRPAHIGFEQKLIDWSYHVGAQDTSC
jgi:hypothetical protein